MTLTTAGEDHCEENLLAPPIGQSLFAIAVA